MEKNKKTPALLKKPEINRKVMRISVISFLLLCVLCNGAFADTGAFNISALDSLGDVLKGALASTWLKAILATALVIEFGVAAWGQSKGASELVSGAVKWMFATGGMLGATGIANFIFDEVEVEEITFIFNTVTNYLG